MSRQTRRHDQADTEEWTRRKLLALVGLIAAAGVLLTGGLVWSVWPTRARESVRSSPAFVDPAESAWPTLGLEAARPGPLTVEPFEHITLPPSTSVGPVGVKTGFPQTGEGAIAQLAAIDQAALQSVSLGTAQRIIIAWAMPGGPTSQTWSGTKAIAGMLEGAGETPPEDIVVSAEPVMAQVRDRAMGYVEACVDFVVTVTIHQTARIAVADCQRMAWQEGRWMIGPGPEPPQPPSVWPGTLRAHQVGFLTVDRG